MEVDLHGFSVQNMEAKLEGFSIREYVSKMRTVDATKCWPFGNEDRINKEANIDDFLPPIIVKKYRWWSHELDLQAHSTRDIFHNQFNVIDGNESEKLVEDKVDAVSLSPVRHEGNDVHVVDRGNVTVVVETTNKGKRTKTPKKRSIVEICAVAPPLQKNGEGDLMRTVKKKCKLKKEKLKKKISKKVFSTPNKERSLQLKQQTPVSFDRLYSNFSFNKKFPNDIFSGSVHKKKATPKRVTTKKKHKALPTSRLIERLQKPNLSVCGIPKNERKASLGKKSIKVRDLQCARDKNSIEFSERHVRFSGKEEILGPRRKHISSIHHSKSKSRSMLFLDTIDVSSSKDHCLSSNEELILSGSDEDVSFASDDGSDLQPLHESDNYDHFDTPRISRPQIDCKKTVDNVQYKSVSFNQPGFDGGNSPTSSQGNSTISNKILQQDRTFIDHLPLHDRSNLISNDHSINGSRDSSTRRRMIDRTSYPTLVAPTASSMAYLKELGQPSSSCLDINRITKDRISSLPHNTNRNYSGRPPEYRLLNHMSHNESMGNLSSFPKQNVFMFGGKSIDNDYFGLPLNSQGELVPLNSSSKGGFNRQKACIVTGSSSLSPKFNHAVPEAMGKCFSVNERQPFERTLPQDHHKFIPFEKYVKEIPSSFPSARFAVAGSQSDSNTNLEQGLDPRRSNQPLRPLESEETVRDISAHTRQHGQVQNGVGTGPVYLHDHSNQMPSHITQPTMRLMGTDVTVGSKSSSKDSQGVDNGKVWTDKEIIKEHRPIGTITNSLIDRRLYAEQGSPNLVEPSNNHFSHLFDVRNSVSQSFLQSQAQDCRSPYSHLNLSWKTNALSQNSNHGISESTYANMHAFVHPAFSTFPDRVPNLISEVTSQVPVPQSFPLNTCQHMRTNSVEFKYKQNLPHVTKSAFQFPFLHPDCGTNIEPPCFHETSNLPPWMLQASKPYSCANGLHFPPIPFVCKTPVGSYPYDYPITSHSHMRNSLGSASLPHPSPVHINPGYKPLFDKNMGFVNKSRLEIPVRKFELLNKTKKRLAVQLDDSRRRTKMPKLGMQEIFNASMGSNRRDNSSSERQCISQVFEVNRNKDSSSIVKYNLKDCYKDNLQPSSGIDSSKLNKITRSGPHKLSAGVKHILQPCQSTDQDNSTATHSTIPFPVTFNSGRVPEIPSAIYRL